MFLPNELAFSKIITSHLKSFQKTLNVKINNEQIYLAGFLVLLMRNIFAIIFISLKYY